MYVQVLCSAQIASTGRMSLQHSSLLKTLCVGVPMSSAASAGDCAVGGASQLRHHEGSVALPVTLLLRARVLDLHTRHWSRKGVPADMWQAGRFRAGFSKRSIDLQVYSGVAGSSAVQGLVLVHNQAGQLASCHGSI